MLPSSATKQCRQSVPPSSAVKEEVSAEKAADSLAQSSATNEANEVNAAKDCLAAKKDAADKAAGSRAKAKEAAAAEDVADSLPCSAVESTLNMNRLKARSMDQKLDQQIGSRIPCQGHS